MKLSSLIDNLLKEQIMLVDGDVFTEKPAVILQEIEQFLNIPAFFSQDHFVFTGKWFCLQLQWWLIHESVEGKKGYPCFKVDQETEEKCMNSSKKARDHPTLTSDSRELLRELFHPSITEFNNQTGMNIRLL